MHAGHRAPPALAAWGEALDGLFDNADLDPALLAELLTPPGEIELAEDLPDAVDPEAVRVARLQLMQHLAQCLGAERLTRRYADLGADAGDGLDAASQARRRLKGVVLQLLEQMRPDEAQRLAGSLFAHAGNMTDRLLAFQMLLRSPQRDDAAARFRQRHVRQPLAMDKWFAAQAQVPGEATLGHVRELTGDEAFILRNPNRVNALLGSFARGNPTGFHRADGAGYRFLTEQLAVLDELNPQVAARLATTFNGWKRLEPMRREAAHRALAELSARDGLSRDLSDILTRALQG